jgi:peroxiredoxin
VRSDDLYALPPGLPVPVDDGACRHLVGATVPPVALPSTAGREVRLDQPSDGPVVVYCYPRTGRPDEEPPGGLAAWNAIPGARGCTPQSCAYRDRHAELRALGVRVFGLSTQPASDQREAAERLHLPFELLSDVGLAFTRALRLPTFEHAGRTLLKRHTLVLEGGRVVACVYPVFPPDADAANVADWLRGRRASGGRAAHSHQ